MTYEQALDYLHSFAAFVPGAGLERIQPLLDRLGHPERKLRFLHIAGTNGKGSTAAFCAQMLTHAGYRCGLFTSPFVVDFRERFQIGGEMIPPERLAGLTARMQPVLEEMKAQGQLVTEFDLLTALAFLYFLEERCDVACLEVGLGGRLDSTNAIPAPLVELITSISLDHTRILGDTIPKIAAEKAGIIKPDSDCVCYPRQDPQAAEVLRARCAQTGSRFHQLDPASIRILQTGPEGSRFSLAGRSYRIGLAGEHQVYNAAAALQAMEILRRKGFTIPEQAAADGLAETRFPARFERLREHPAVIVDGAHNPEGAAGLSATLRGIPGRKILLIGMMADKDSAHALELLCTGASAVLCVSVQNPRALPPEELAEQAKAFCPDTEVFHDLRAAYRRALALAGTDGSVVVCGSFFLAGEMIPLIRSYSEV